MTFDKKTERGDSKFFFSNKVMACKWMDNRLVLLLSTALEGYKRLQIEICCHLSKGSQIVQQRDRGVDLMDQTGALH